MADDEVSAAIARMSETKLQLEHIFSRWDNPGHGRTFPDILMAVSLMSKVFREQHKEYVRLCKDIELISKYKKADSKRAKVPPSSRRCPELGGQLIACWFDYDACEFLAGPYFSRYGNQPEKVPNQRGRTRGEAFAAYIRAALVEKPPASS